MKAFLTGASGFIGETATCVDLLEERGLPYVVLRAVSERADEDLPVDFGRFRGRDGATGGARVAAHGLSHPWILPALARLRARVAGCAMELASVVERLVRDSA